MRDNLKVGTDGELSVASKMAQLGFSVAFPVGNEKYDLIAEKDGKCRRIQVKTGTFQPKGSYRCCLVHGRQSKEGYNKDDCDALVLYAPYSRDYEGIHEDGFYVIPIKDIMAGGKYHAILFPAGLGRGNIATCSWEEYRDAWEGI